MILTEPTAITAADLPIAEFREFLRLGTGFADDGLQDGVLESCLRAAVSAIEARTGKVMIQRPFLWSLTGWRDTERQGLPVAPVVSLTSVTVRDAMGVGRPVDPLRYRLMRDAQRPVLLAASGCFPVVPRGGSVEVAFVAGYGAVWSDVPDDLAQAVLLLAARYYDRRHDGAGECGVPAAVAALIAPYRVVRIFGGGGS